MSFRYTVNDSRFNPQKKIVKRNGLAIAWLKSVSDRWKIAEIRPGVSALEIEKALNENEISLLS